MSTGNDHESIIANLTDKARSRLAIIFVVVIIILSSLPVLLSYTPYHPGHDTVFHLYRIDGIAKGLAEGQFPVMMQSSQIAGYGYPVSICYGDLFLYFPALLRLLGFSMHAAYALFIMAINGLCAITTYITFKRMFGKRGIGILACALWTLSPYRLAIDTYLRSAVGEFISLSMFPAVLYGIYSMIWYRSPNASKNGWIWCAAGVCGVVYSHILSVLMGVITFLPMLAFELVKKRDPIILRNVILAVVATLGLSLAFAIPFLDFYSGMEMKVNTQDPSFKQALASANALQPAQLFELFPEVSNGSVAGKTIDEMPYGIGWSLLSAIPLWGTVMAMKSTHRHRSDNAYLLGSFVLLQIAVLMWMTTVYFPWGFDSNPIGQTFISLLATIQFPWRLVGPISFMLLLLMCLGLNRIQCSPLRRATSSIIICIIGLSLIECGFGVTSFLRHSQAVDEHYVNHDAHGVMGGEYLPKDFDVATTTRQDDEAIVSTPGIAAIPKDGNTVTSYSIHVENKGRAGSLVIPLIKYPHYHAKTESGDELAIDASDDGLIQIAIPERYAGTINIAFTPPFSWRAAQVSSLLAATGLACCLLFGKMRNES